MPRIFLWLFGLVGGWAAPEIAADNSDGLDDFNGEIEEGDSDQAVMVLPFRKLPRVIGREWFDEEIIRLRQVLAGQAVYDRRYPPRVAGRFHNTGIPGDIRSLAPRVQLRTLFAILYFLDTRIRRGAYQASKEDPFMLHLAFLSWSRSSRLDEYLEHEYITFQGVDCLQISFEDDGVVFRTQIPCRFLG